MEIPNSEIAARRALAEQVKANTILPDGFIWRTEGNVAAGDRFMDMNGSFHPISDHHVGQTIGEFYAIARKA